MFIKLFYHETSIDAVLCVKISVIIITRLTIASTRINISGKNKISMPDLKTALGAKNCGDVKQFFDKIIRGI